MDSKVVKSRRSKSPSRISLRSTFRPQSKSLSRSKSLSPSDKPKMTKEELMKLNYIAWHAYNKFQLRDLAKRYQIPYDKKETKDELAEKLFEYFQSLQKEDIDPLLGTPPNKKKILPTKGELVWEESQSFRPPNIYERKSSSSSPKEPFMSKEQLMDLNFASWHALSKSQLIDIARKYQVKYDKKETKDEIEDKLYHHFKNRKWIEQFQSLFELPYTEEELKDLNLNGWKKFTISELIIIADKYKIKYPPNSNQSDLLKILYEYFHKDKNTGNKINYFGYYSKLR
jgi:hypothetical protein